MSRLKLALAGLSSLVLAVATTADAAIHLEAENGTLTGLINLKKGEKYYSGSRN